MNVTQQPNVTFRRVTLPGLSQRDPAGVPAPGCDTPGLSQSGHVTPLVLSLFPGIDLLGMGFEEAGFCVVRGPDLIFGGDIRLFNAPRGRFDGIIGGPPCQDYSRKRRTPPTGYGNAMLEEFKRIVEQARPLWWLMENVAEVPDLTIAGYSWQRLDLRAAEFGLEQNRLRHFQFGQRTGYPLILPREQTTKATQPCALASEGTKADRRAWPEFCQLQGLPPDFSLPAFKQSERYRAVGNGVPVPMARAIAEAIKKPNGGIPCACSCGRPLKGGQTYATPACRKRAQRRRDQRRSVTPLLSHAIEVSQ